MVRKTYGRKITVQRCTQCAGLFAKPDVLMEMKKEWMSEVLDTGDPKVGRRYDEVTEIKCPECGSAMNKVADPKQPHIGYESCPSCEGMFFDAGEFSDWKHETFWDKIRDLIRDRRAD